MPGTYKTGILGISNAGSDPPLQTRRKYDRSDKILLRALADAPVLHIIVSRAQKRAVKDVKYYMFEDDYFVQSGTLKGCTSAGADTALTTSLGYVYVAGENSEAANTFLRVGDILHIPAFQTNQSATKGTGDGSTDGTVMMAGEDMIVREIVDANVVRVTRGGGAGTLAGNVTASSAASVNFELKGNVMADASASPSAISDSIEEDYNYREIKRMPWDISGRNLMQDVYGTPDIQRLAVKNRTQLLRYMERTFWTNHRYLSYGANGLEESHTGGFFEFVCDTSATWTRVAAYDASKDLVMGDASQRVWKVNKNFSLSNWNRFLEKSLKWGSKSKLLVIGRSFAVELEDLLRPYYGAFTWDVDTFGFGVIRAQNSFGQIPIVVEQEWSTGAAGYDYHAACLDMDYLWYTYGVGPCAIKGCGNQNSDIHVHQNIQANDENHRKDELYVDYGWDQRFRKAHSWLIWDGTK